jgi:hypothetical protein
MVKLPVVLGTWLPLWHAYHSTGSGFVPGIMTEDFRVFSLYVQKDAGIVPQNCKVQFL